KVVSISAFDAQGVSFRVDSLDGDYFGWTRDSKGLEWTRGTSFYEKPVDEVIAKRGAARATGLAVEYDVAVPEGVVALTNARVITMDGTRKVIENATVIIRGNKIESVGTGVAVPS